MKLKYPITIIIVLSILLIPSIQAKTDYLCAGQPIYLNNTVINDWVDFQSCNGGLIENVTFYRLESSASSNLVFRNVFNSIIDFYTCLIYH